MPREIIWKDTPSEDGKGVLAEVLWAKDQFVQIGVAEYNRDDSVKNSLFTDLSRKQINDLIRDLRRARDQAYGRDE